MTKKTSPSPETGASDSRRVERAQRDAERLAALEELVPAWLAVPEAAERQSLPLSAVRRQIQDRELLAVRRGKNKALYIPESFVTDEGPRPELKGTFTVLADGGKDDLDLLLWLFSPDDSFQGGSPMLSLLSGHKTEVRRRAMEEAF